MAKRTLRGERACAQWLSYCLSIGWPKDDLPGLRKLFWRVRDHNGNLKARANAG